MTGGGVVIDPALLRGAVLATASAAATASLAATAEAVGLRRVVNFMTLVQPLRARLA